MTFSALPTLLASEVDWNTTADKTANTVGLRRRLQSREKIRFGASDTGSPTLLSLASLGKSLP